MAVNVTLPEGAPLSATPAPAAPTTEKIASNVVLLTNCVAPYSLPMLRRLAVSVKRLQVLVSVPMERDRHWKPMWGGIDVAVQRSFTFAYRRRFRQGFSEVFFVHFPYDCLLLLRRYRPDAIISAQLGFRTLQAIIFRLVNPATRLIIWVDASERTEQEIGPLRSAIRRLLLKAADAVLTNGASGARYLNRLQVPCRRIVFAPYVAEVSAFAAIPLHKKPSVARRFLYVGQLIERKGLAPFLRALSRWGDSHTNETCEIWIVGDGPLRDHIQALPISPGIRIRFFGNVPYDGLAGFYKEGGIFVLPTLADTWAVVVNEALAAGLPVLGSLYSQAVQELVVDGENGWTIYPDRPDQLQSAIERVLSTPLDALAKMREAARRSVAHLTPEYLASQFLKAIRKAMEQGE